MSLARALRSYERPDPGNPLWPWAGPKLSLRPTHRKRWKGVLRRDPCSYCGAQGGTIDHIVPKAIRRLARPYGIWCDYTGACSECNTAKGDRLLLFFLLEHAS